MLQKGTPRMSTHRTAIKHKVGLLRLAQELGNVSQACKVMGNTFTLKSPRSRTGDGTAR